MTIAQITERQTVEAKVYDIARQIRALLDEADSLDLPDGRSGAEEALELATE